MADHEYYTGLSASVACALAISGQLSEPEGGEWIEHVGSCAECRQLMHDFMRVSFRLLPEGDTVNGTSRVLAGAAQASVERARSSVPVAEPSAEFRQVVTPRRSRLQRVAFCAGVAASLILAFSLGSVLGKRQDLSSPLSHSQPVNPSDNIGSATQIRDLLAERERLKSQLQGTQKRAEVLAREQQEQTGALASTQLKNTDLNSRIAVLEKANREFGDKELHRNSELLQVRKDLEALRAESEAKQNAATAIHAELVERHVELVRLSDQLKDAQRLIATLKQAQALVEGRKVHLWDVYDTDENGKRQAAYGRILYTEGDVLAFYVFDLAQYQDADTRISFYVWGEKAGTRQPVKNLGILHVDDAKKNRWKLTFDDGNVLAQINSVFITAEPSRNAAIKPRGKKILSTRLDSRTDHP